MSDMKEKRAASPDADYGANYYASHCGPIPYSRQFPEWSAFFAGVADRIVALLRPKRVFDAGCAHGFLIEALWDRGVQAWGRDISSFAVSQARLDMRPFVSAGSITEPLGGPFDLVTCVEVLEHMTEEDTTAAIAAMAAAAPLVLFSSSPTDLDEPTHITVRPIRWWLDRFAAAGLAPMPDFDASFLTPHAYLLQRTDEPITERLLDNFAALMRMRMTVKSEESTIHALRGEIATAFAALAETRATAEAARAELAGTSNTLQHTAALLEHERAWAGELDRERSRLSGIITETHRAQADAAAEIGALRDHVAGLEEVERAFHRSSQHLSAVLGSTSWRLTRPLRTALGLMPPGARHLVRRTIRLAYWTATFQLPAGWREWKEAQRRLALLPATPSPLQVSAAPADTPPLPPLGSAMDRSFYARWAEECDRLTVKDRLMIRGHIQRFRRQPMISVLLPAYNTPAELLREAIASVRAQLYPVWELCIADDASTQVHVRDIIEDACAKDARIRSVRRAHNGHISAASNSALELAQGEYVALLDHDDILAEHALYEIVAALDRHPDTDVVFSDEDRLQDGVRHSPYFKPGWDPDLLLGQNSVSHLGVYRTSLLREIGGFREGYEGSQDHDLALRAIRVAGSERVKHVPAVLYHWRLRGDGSFSDTQLARCVDASRRAVSEYVRALPGGEGAQVVANPFISSFHRVVWPLPDELPKVTAIIPTRDKAHLLAMCMRGLLNSTEYGNLEVLIVDNGSSEPDALRLLDEMEADPRVRVLRDGRPFNYAALNNCAAREATGEFLLLLNNDIEVTDAGWLREMVSQALRPGVGTVGAKLLYPDGRIQHAGVVLGVGSFDGGPGIAGHFGHNEPKESVGYFGHSALQRTVSANTAACLVVRRAVFLEVGGFDEAKLPIAFNDVDLCLRIGQRGLRHVWTPFAELLHHESASRGKDHSPENIARSDSENHHMRKAWGVLLDSDPFFNPNFSRTDHTHQLPRPGRRVPSWRLPPDATP